MSSTIADADLDPSSMTMMESILFMIRFAQTRQGLEVLRVPFYWFLFCQCVAWSFHVVMLKTSRLYQKLGPHMKGEATSSFVSTIHCCCTATLLIGALATDDGLWHDKVFAQHGDIFTSLRFMVGYCMHDLAILCYFGSPDIVPMLVHHVLGGVGSFVLLSPIGGLNGWFVAMLLVCEAANPWMNLHFFLKLFNVDEHRFVMRVTMFVYTVFWVVFRLGPWWWVWPMTFYLWDLVHSHNVLVLFFAWGNLIFLCALAHVMFFTRGPFRKYYC